MGGRLFLLMLVTATIGCTTVRFRVSPDEIQRLAELPSGQRGNEVRVVPWNTAPGHAAPCVTAGGVVVMDSTAAALGLAVIVADLVDAPAQDRAAFARTFEGPIWMKREQVIHVQYDDGRLREIPLARLTPADAVNVRYAHVSEDDGRVTPWRHTRPVPASADGGN